MPSEFSPDTSSEQAFARKRAAQELARYCQEFSRWLETKRGRAAVDQSLPKQAILRPTPMKAPDAPAPRTSA